MAGLPRSDVSFRRSGSSGLVWEDKLLSGELKPKGEELQKVKTKPDPKPYPTVAVAPTMDPPSPKVSGCCAMFSKTTTTTGRKPNKRGHRKS
ncbi:hypothetical protein L1887_38248 [Cichorium endivia]|nr:hypothetical protein L1887_38248 [Cichorium endivia]